MQKNKNIQPGPENNILIKTRVQSILKCIHSTEMSLAVSYLLKNVYKNTSCLKSTEK